MKEEIRTAALTVEMFRFRRWRWDDEPGLTLDLSNSSAGIEKRAHCLAHFDSFRFLFGQQFYFEECMQNAVGIGNDNRTTTSRIYVRVLFPADTCSAA